MWYIARVPKPCIMALQKCMLHFSPPGGGKTVVIMQLLNVWEHQVDGQGGFTDGFNQQSLGCLPLDWHGGINASPKTFSLA